MDQPARLQIRPTAYPDPSSADLAPETRCFIYISLIVMVDESHPRIRIGTCGFAEVQDKLFSDFSLLEVQKTFYQPPKVETAERWRRKAPSDFVFTLKAWQLITHESSSPTYRRLTESLSDEERSQCGRFRWNDTTRKAWDRIQRIADALEAPSILFQTPKSFEPTRDNLSNIRTFLSQANRDGRTIVFEPRGEDWTDEVVEDLANDLDIVHGVDPFLRSPATTGLRYYRLHGRPNYTYSYTYTTEDFEELEEQIPDDEAAWIFFNNRTMADDARELQERLGSA